MKQCIKNNYECSQGRIVKSYCPKHYIRLKKHGNVDFVMPYENRPKRQKSICKLGDCNYFVEGLGYCRKHYRAFKKYGNPLYVASPGGRFTSESVKLLHKSGVFKSFYEKNSGANHKWFKGAKTEALCLKCGVSFWYYKANRVVGNYCSKKCSYVSPERSEKLRKANLGRKASPEVIKKLSLAHVGLKVGAQVWNWKGGVSKMNQKLRSTPEYSRWRVSVFERDHYECQMCLERGGKLEADHYPYSFSGYPEKRLDVNNGRTVCQICHYVITFLTPEWGCYFKRGRRNA